MKTRELRVAFVVLCGLAVLASTAVAGDGAGIGAGIRFTAKDGSIVCAQTMDFGSNAQSNMFIVPRDWKFVGTGANNAPGFRWTTKYGYVGPNTNDQTWVYDGLNEKGLAVSSFQFQGAANQYNNANTQYNNAQNKNAKYKTTPNTAGKYANHTLASYQVATYVLGACATVQEAITALQNFYVYMPNTTSAANAAMNTTNTTNIGTGTWTYAIYDAAGHGAVIEYVNGQMNVHNNVQGIVANTQMPQWYLKNLRNYIRNAPSTDAGQQCVAQAFHVLNQFDTSTGMTNPNNQTRLNVGKQIKTTDNYPKWAGNNQGKTAGDLPTKFNDNNPTTGTGNNPTMWTGNYTTWTTAADLTHLYYYYTYQNHQVKMINLNKIDLNVKNIKTFSMQQDTIGEDVPGTTN